jgi:tetratricopeptide (TPR) repeat protein
VQATIRELKSRLRADPRTALIWADLARGYAALGQRHRADHAMRVALALLPNHRFLLRSAARLSIHLGDPERAHRLLATTPGTPGDPWLVAAEIAVAPLAERQSKMIKHGRKILESNRFHPGSLSELASALATESLTAGNGRDARRLFERSLGDPTENAVAQAAWAARQGARIEIPPDLLNDVEDSFEARAQLYAEAGDVGAALENAWAWLRAEPFAGLPAAFGSHEAALARNYEEAIRFTDFGLIANPDDFFLLNNRAFALASTDEVDLADEQIKKIKVDSLEPDEKLVLQATKGLVAFRRGDFVLGRALYLQTIQSARDTSLRAVAAILLAREELIAGTSLGSASRRAAEDLVAGLGTSPSIRSERVPAWLAHLEAETTASV